MIIEWSNGGTIVKCRSRASSSARCLRSSEVVPAKVTSAPYARAPSTLIDAASAAAAAAGVSCELEQASGDYSFEEIVRAAQRRKCDLIYMASHGRRGIARLLLGSETSKVLAHSKVPVMVCR